MAYGFLWSVFLHCGWLCQWSGYLWFVFCMMYDCCICCLVRKNTRYTQGDCMIIHGQSFNKWLKEKDMSCVGHWHIFWQFTNTSDFLWHIGEVSPTFPTKCSRTLPTVWQHYITFHVVGGGISINTIYQQRSSSIASWLQSC